jgi:uncharacterized membrane protein YraQ (UPF0718 family)
MTEAAAIGAFVAGAIWKVLPAFLVSVGLGVLIRALALDGMIRRAVEARVGVAVLLATAVGAFSPLCSCTVIPVISGLLLSGVPLAPVMAFWVASPTMDPEMFALTVATLGWPLAVIRLAATLVLSLGAGYLTLALTRSGLLSADVLRESLLPRRVAPPAARLPLLSVPVLEPAAVAARAASPAAVSISGASDGGAGACCGGSPATLPAQPIERASDGPTGSCCGGAAPDAPVVRLSWRSTSDKAPGAATTVPVAGASEARQGSCCGAPAAASTAGWAFTERLRAVHWPTFGGDVARETWRLGRWLVLAFVLEAVMLRYVPQAAIAGVLGEGSRFAVVLAALVGIPLYLNNVSALPIVSGLLAQGMQPGAAIAFLIAGPVTTVPAMSAVWGVVKPRVFALYVGVALVGAVVFGWLTNLAL